MFSIVIKTSLVVVQMGLFLSQENMIMNNSNNEWWRWELNRKIAEFLSRPTREQEATLGFLLTSYRALYNQRDNTSEARQDRLA